MKTNVADLLYIIPCEQMVHLEFEEYAIEGTSESVSEALNKDVNEMCVVSVEASNGMVVVVAKDEE